MSSAPMQHQANGSAIAAAAVAAVSSTNGEPSGGLNAPIVPIQPHNSSTNGQASVDSHSPRTAPPTATSELDAAKMSDSYQIDVAPTLAPPAVSTQSAASLASDPATSNKLQPPPASNRDSNALRDNEQHEGKAIFLATSASVDSSDDDASRFMQHFSPTKANEDAVASEDSMGNSNDAQHSDSNGIIGSVSNSKRDISHVEAVSPSNGPPSKKTASSKSTEKLEAVDVSPAHKPERNTVAPPTAPGTLNDDQPTVYPDFAALVNLDPVPQSQPLPRLSSRDLAELEMSLQIGDKWDHSDDNTWRGDWSGNLQLIDKELVMNKYQLAEDPSAKLIKVSFCDWATKNADFRPIRLLFSHIYHMHGTPPMAQKCLSYALSCPAKTVQERREHILEAVRRISYDPIVLNQDGWTTEKAVTPEGASGGAHLIGRRLMWERFEAIVIAFVHDDDLGDLWKAMWLEDLDTFDLEADELQGALKKWKKREALKEKRALGGAGKTGSGKKPITSQRFSASSNLSVDGIEHGIVLAMSYHANARHGILWPARIMHVSEVKALGSSALSRRSSSKNVVHAVFLAPYWNGAQASSKRSLSGTFHSGDINADNPFCTGPLFELETVETSTDTIKAYLCDDDMSDNNLNIDKLRASFRFLGLPKAAFPRYLDSHRIALALKRYARKELVKSSPSNDTGLAGALSSLTETHSLTVKTPRFPPAVLGLPFDYALSKLPHPTEQSMIGAEGEETTEPVMKLDIMLKAMVPPLCWGVDNGGGSGGDSSNNAGRVVPSTPVSARTPLSIKSPTTTLPNPANKTVMWGLNDFATDYLLSVIGNGRSQSAPAFLLGMHLSGLLDQLSCEATTLSSDIFDMRRRKQKLRLCLRKCLVVKGHGEDLLVDAQLPKDVSRRTVLIEWRKSCERIYKRASIVFSAEGFGNGVTTIITDSRCNQHITANGSFERAVRLPTALKGCKNAGAGTNKNMPLINTVEEHYIEMTERTILPKAHKKSYLKRLKNKIAALPADAKGVPLTDDSDGEGGEDTMGSRGSFTAAVVGVAAALKAVDMIVEGECVNVFCAIRPPGHHAGRELRPMKAISNGFCLLNAAASAALYATAPRAEGGLGLKRVCVIDFDVHHGNGTQDVLCSTHDSRFLYVSLHAGGPHINGYEEPGDSDDGLYRHSLGTSKNEGIFPGRCGDISPHEGVLNIPLGQKVTAAAMGQALVTQVAPAVDKFSPELIILSAGFDAHVNDPLGMGGLTAEDFGNVTEVACQMAFKSCSGRVLSVLEGGYGVPCCVPQRNLFLPDGIEPLQQTPPPHSPAQLLDLGCDLPSTMDDQVPEVLRAKLDRCHQEGFLQAVQSHVSSLAKSNQRSPKEKTTESIES